MNYATIERPYNTLTEEQQAIVYDLVLSLAKLNSVKTQPETVQKRTFGKFANTATAVFANDWTITEQDLCAL
ncbi:MAG: hypothetical protein IKZ88_00020 [Neisseriaceae bacterium]|nr:hypothetical protein [Neisseriaceae bacterium]